MYSLTTASRSVSLHGLRIGQPVYVNDRAGWLLAMITDLTHRSVKVTFTADQPARRCPIVPAWVVRPAPGVHLKPVTEIRSGECILTFSGELKTIACPPYDRGDRWIIDYTDGDRMVVAGTALLRLHNRRLTEAVTAPMSDAGARRGAKQRHSQA